MPESADRKQGGLWWEYVLVLFLAAILYYVSVAPGVLWQDSGLAQLRVLRGDYVGQLGLALAHPLFYLVAGALQWLPFHNSAFKTNLVSATAASVTVANVYLLLVCLLGRDRSARVGAVTGTLAIALAHTFWQHAALAEVYTLSTMILTFELLALVRFARGGSIGWWLAAWFLNGLECSNHMLATLTAAAILIWSIYLCWLGRFKARWFILAVTVWMIGALPYEYLGFRMWRDGASIGSVLNSALFGHYRDNVLNVAPKGRLLGMAVMTILLNFATVNIVFIPLGLIAGIRRLAARLGLLLLLATVIHLLFAVRYRVPDQYTFFIIPVLFLAMWLGVGVADVVARRPRAAAIVIALALTNPIVYAELPGLIERCTARRPEAPIPYRNEFKYFLWPWKTGYRGPERFAREVLDRGLTTENAVIISDGTARRPLSYYRMVEHLRPDVTIVSDPYPEATSQPTARKVEYLCNLMRRRGVYIVRNHPKYCPEWILDNFRIERAGCIYRLVAPVSTAASRASADDGQND